MSRTKQFYPVFVRLAQDQIDKADKLAELRRSNRSQVIRELIDLGVKNLGKFD